MVTLGPIRVGRVELPHIEATLLTRNERRSLGASTVVIFAGTSGMSIPMVVGSDASEAASVLTTRKIHVMRLLELRIGDLALHNQPAVILARTDGEHDVDGLLPLHVFARVSFRHRDGIMVVSR